ncbi:MAG: hypothetical protein FJY95_10865 [Candidatus Handelsmanbacteria bacterium]|nr:hypothetical protein [Candidatus Handelsmanbacteria bacterium]
MSVLWRLAMMVTMLSGCDTAPTESDKLPSLDAQLAYARHTLNIPDLQGNPLVVDELAIWTFDDGVWRYERLIGPHPSSQVPPNHNLLYWAAGQYWLDSTDGRDALYVFERQEGAGWSFRTDQMVPQEPATYSQVVIFGQNLVSINEDTYTLAPLDSLERLRR